MRGKRITAVWIYAAFAVVVAFFLGPVLWMISLGFKPQSQVFAYPPTLIPRPPTLEEFIFVVANSHIPIYMLNSVFIAAALVVLIYVTCIPGAYAFSRFRFRGKKFLLLMVLSFQMIAPIVIVVPLYTMLNSFGLLDTRFGLILTLVGVQVPFSVWLLKGFFDSIPISLDESALIDGASRLETVMRVILPVAGPGVAAVTIFNFIFGWSNFILPVIIITSEQLSPFSVGIFIFQSGYGTSWNKIAAASALGLLPVMAVYVAFQRFIVSGLMSGSVKG